MLIRLQARSFNFFLLIFTGFSVALSGCAGLRQAPLTSHGFVSFLWQQQGQQVPGQVVYPAGREMPFKGERLWLEVKTDGRRGLRVPIYRNQEIYRTLIISRDEQGYLLQHENKLPDGRQARVSLYGGYDVGGGSPEMMIFPADAYNRQLLGSLRENVWTLAFNHDKSLLSYIVEENGHVTLQIDFDLSRAWPAEKTAPPPMVDGPRGIRELRPAPAFWGPAA